ncbi:hypothetical protein ACHAWU_001884 [Discostella pseudostelligera]|uniref:Uncharacterized protein n=1 Tax=Discostella pseudostelligera TaxID=259834 RepID=A0ABD3MIQ4_9STRA
MMSRNSNSCISYFNYHQQYQEGVPSKCIQKLSHHDLVQGSITAEISTSPKRKRDDIVGEITWKQQQEDDDDDLMCPVQKRSASSTRPNSTYCMCSYDMESRDGPADDISLDDETARLVSNCRISVFRQDHRGISSSATLTRPSPAIFAEEDDEDVENGYSDFPSIGRARTITDSDDSIFLTTCYTDPPDMHETSRSDCHDIEELTDECIKTDHIDYSAHMSIGLDRHERKDESDEMREFPESIRTSTSVEERSQSSLMWKHIFSTTNQIV